MSDFAQTYQKYLALLNECIATNKTAVFTALEAARITSVQVDFDGEGDTGDITCVAALIGETSVDLPELRVQTVTAHYGAETIHRENTESLTEAITHVCLDVLSAIADGWQNNDGATGTFMLDVARRTIHLKLGQRFSDFAWSCHEL